MSTCVHLFAQKIVKNAQKTSKKLKYDKTKTEKISLLLLCNGKCFCADSYLTYIDKTSKKNLFLKYILNKIPKL